MRQAPYYMALAICSLFAVVGLVILAFLTIRIEAALVANPDAFRLEWLGIGALAVVFTAVGIVGVGRVVRQKRLVERLLREGLRRDGAIVDFVQAEERVARHKGASRIELVWYVVVEWTDQTGRLWRERGERLLHNPATRFTIGDKVVVLVDSRKPEKFWIDFDGEAKTVGQGISYAAADNPIVRR